MSASAVIASGFGVSRIDVIAPGFLIGLWATAITLASLAVSAVVRRRHAARRIALALSATALVVVAAADSVNAHYAFLPTLTDASQVLPWEQPWPASTALDHLRTHTLNTASRQGLTVVVSLPADRPNGLPPTTNVVYLPPQYFTEPGQHFPVVYLMHGSPGRPADWFLGGQAGRVARLLAADGAPTIVVAPQLSRSWTDDPECVDGVKERIESHLFQVLIPTVDARFRTRPDRGGRVFAGMSAGGFCALNLGLRHRDAVATIVDLSGESELTHDGGPATLFGRHNSSASALVAANDPLVYARTLSPRPAMRIWLDTGSEDRSIRRGLTQLATELEARGFDISLHVRPGGHTYRVWTAALRAALPWALGVDAGRPLGQR